MVNGIGKSVFIVGIGGISLSAIAKILKVWGHEVSGFDKTKSEQTEKLKDYGIDVCYLEKEIDLTGVDAVVYSSAISEEFIALKQARENGIKVLARAECLNLISNEYNKVVAVAGSHGKTTTTAILTTILDHSNKDFTSHIGGELVAYNSNVLRRGGNDIFVTEACEYRKNFLSLSPDIAVVLNLDLDHVDIYNNQDEIIDVFIEFTDRVKAGGVLVINIDDDSAEKILKRTNKNKRIVTYSIKNSKADYYIKYNEDAEVLKFVVYNKNNVVGDFVMNNHFEHNLYNALAGIIVSIELGVAVNTIRAGVENFRGVKRRFEEIGTINGARVVLDYAHHPQEIKSVLSSSKSHTKGKIYAIFQPHTYSRTKYFWSDFIKSLSIADNVIMYPIYPAREKSMMGISSKRMAEDLRRINKVCYYSDSMEEIKSYLGYFATKDDLVLVLGAGDIEKFRLLLNQEKV